jgi:hypothetical protein
MASVFAINKGVARSIEFKGFKAQYIWYVGGAAIGLVILFAILYISGINSYMCLLIVLPLGAYTILKIQGLSKKYGEHGMMKMIARKRLPEVLKMRTGVFYEMQD